MRETSLLERISSHPEVMSGKAVIKDTRLTVDFILSLLAKGASEEEILNEYKGLNQDDIRACLLYASKVVEGATVIPLAGSLH